MATPEPKRDNKKVVVGFTGRLDSLIAAYLLKKQGFEVLAVAISFAPREPDMIKEDPEDDESKDIPETFYGVDLIGDLMEVQKVAQSIGVNFYAVDASEQYKHFVLDRIVASRMVGMSFSPKYYSHALIFDILLEKSKLLNAAHIATGHFAKISSKEAKSPLRVLSSNDLENDQCHLLSFVKKEALSKIMLPLSDMRKNEVEKVANSLSFRRMPPKELWSSMQRKPDFAAFIQRRIPQSMIKMGQVIDHQTERIIGDHEGIHGFFIGQNNVKIDKLNTADQDSTIVIIHYKSGNIVLVKNEDLGIERMYLSHVRCSEQDDLSKPMTAYLKRAGFSEKLMGTFLFKNNNFAEFIFNKPYASVMGRGETVVFLAHAKEGAKVIASANVHSAGTDVRYRLSALPDREEDVLGDSAHEKPLPDFYY